MTPWPQKAKRLLPDLVKLRRADAGGYVLSRSLRRRQRLEELLRPAFHRLVIDEAVMARGTAVLAAIAERFLRSSEEFPQQPYLAGA